MPWKPLRNADPAESLPERGDADAERTRALVAGAEQAVIKEKEAIESGEESPG